MIGVTAVSSFNGTVNLSCAVTPAVTPAATCSLSSSSVQVNGNPTPPLIVTVATVGPMTTSAVSLQSVPPTRMAAWVVVLLVVLGRLSWHNQRRRAILNASLIALGLICFASCGGGGSPPPPAPHIIPVTPSGTYTATITGTAGSLARNATVSVVVQ
jgi:hypothetical protein